LFVKKSQKAENSKRGYWPLIRKIDCAKKPFVKEGLQFQEWIPQKILNITVEPNMEL